MKRLIKSKLDSFELLELSEINKFIQKCIDSYQFNDDKIQLLEEFRDGHSTLEQIEVIAKPNLSGSQMEEIMELLLDGKLENDEVDEFINLMYKQNYNNKQKSIIKKGLDAFGFEKTKLYMNPKFNEEQMEQARLGFEHGLNKEQVQNYINIDNIFEMEEIRKELENKNKLNSKI